MFKEKRCVASFTNIVFNRNNNGVLISTENPIEDCYAIIKKEVERVINK